jgi:hypothetical protein
MGTAYKAAIPGATVTVSPEGSCRGRAAAPGSSPRRHAPPCAWQCWRSSPIRPSAPGAEHHARWRAGLKSAPAVATLPAPPQNHGSSTHILPAEYAPVTHRNAGVAGGAQINQSGPSPSGSDMSRHPRRTAGRSAVIKGPSRRFWPLGGPRSAQHAAARFAYLCIAVLN